MYNGRRFDCFEGETSLYAVPKVPFEILHLDHFGLQETSDRFKHILVIVDAFTRFTWLFPVQSTSTKKVINHLKSIFIVFGNPSNIVTNRGTAFTSRDFEKFVESLRVEHRKIVIVSPWANGVVKRVNRFIKSFLAKICSIADEWKEKLCTIQYIINNTYHVVIKSTSSKFMFGYEQRNHDDYNFTTLTKRLSEIDHVLENERNSMI